MANSKVRFETTMGNFTAEIYEDKAPVSAKNFLQYVRDGFYKGTIFHRVIPGFVIQGGGFEPGMKEKKTRAPIMLEVAAKLRHENGSLSMARTNQPNSGTSQFFVCDGTQPALDSNGPGHGYAVFGKVFEGMDTVKKIIKSPTTSKGHHDDVPKNDVIVTSCSIVE